MPLLDHIRIANNAALDRCLPLMWQDRRLGWISEDRAQSLAQWPDVFEQDGRTVRIAEHLDSYEARSRALARVTGALNEAGLIPGWRDELYPVTDQFHKPPLAEVERAACPYLGLRSWGVHMTGFVRRPDGFHLWIARRADDKPNYPGLLDNMVAGGQPLGLSPMENMIKECGEEAGIPPEIANGLRHAGMLSYCHEVVGGLKPDQMFCFDLELPAGFTPVNTDGEVAEFMLLPAAEVIAIVRDSRDFKFNCNLCLIDFFIRHGLVTPDNEPDYAALCIGLQGDPVR